MDFGFENMKTLPGNLKKVGFIIVLSATLVVLVHQKKNQMPNLQKYRFVEPFVLVHLFNYVQFFTKRTSSDF